MKKKREDVSITSPDELDKHLQASSPITWVILIATIGAMLAFFVWSCVYSLPIKLSGTANVVNHQATLVVEKEEKDKLVEGTKVYILNLERTVTIVDGNPVVSNLDLKDGQYTYYCKDIIIREIHPIDYLLKK